MFVYSLIKTVSHFVVGTCVLMFAAFVYTAIKEKRKVKELFKEFCTFVQETVGSFRMPAIIITSIVLIVVLLQNAGIQQLVGFDNIYFKEEGYYSYYVKSGDQQYPALIHISTEEIESGYYGENKKTRYHYYLEQIDLGYRVLEFEPDEHELFVKKEIHAYSVDDVDVWCELVNEHAYSSKFKVTNDVNAWSFISLALQFGPVLVCLIAMTKKSEVENKSF